jgi:hypothetical protein
MQRSEVRMLVDRCSRDCLVTYHESEKGVLDQVSIRYDLVFKYTLFFGTVTYFSVDGILTFEWSLPCSTRDIHDFS